MCAKLGLAKCADFVLIYVSILHFHRSVSLKKMASFLPAIASTYSTSISAMNGVTARSKLGCISTNINGVTFLPAGKLMRSNVGLSSLYRRRTNGLVVRADNEQNSMAQIAWSGKPLTH